MYRLNDIDNYKMHRERMISSLSSRLGGLSVKLLSVLKKVPRHLFVSEALRYMAYDDTSLPIGFNQTISRPSTVARMIQALELNGTEKVLEVGTGSGYQSALLAELAGSVISTERIKELYERAGDILLRGLGYKNITLKNNDNFLEIEGPFDAIIVAAGAEILPEDLFHNLKDNGRLVIPLVHMNGQVVKKYVKTEQGIIERDLCAAEFVPLIYN